MTRIHSYTLLLLAMAILLAVLAACGNGNNEPANTDTPAANDAAAKPAPDTAADVKQADTPPPATEASYTYTFMRNIAIPEYPSDGGEAKPLILAALAKQGLDHFDFTISMAGGSEYYTKLNLLATSGELPDLFDIDGPTLRRFVDQGLVMPIDDYLDAVPAYKQLIPEDRWEQVTFDGKIYGLPAGKLASPINHSSVTSILIRQDWLDQLDLPQPGNLEELHQTLQAFKSDIPDFVGLGGHKDTNFYSIFGAFGIAPHFWIERDGMIKKGFVLPEAKQALAVLREWYQEGLIDPDFPIMEQKQLNEKIINSRVGVWEGSGFMANPQTDATAEALHKASPESVLTMLETPQGPQGLQGYPESVGSLRAFSAETPNPEQVFALLNWMATPGESGGLDLVHYGIEGVDYTYDKENDHIIQLSSYSDLYKKGYSNPIRISGISDRRYALPEVRGAIETATKHLIPNAMWKSLRAEVDYPDLESKLWKEYFVKIVTGVFELDKHDEFVEKYYAQGGKTLEQEANEAWNADK